MLNRTLLTTSGFVIALSIIPSTKANAQNQEFNAHPVKFFAEPVLGSKVSSFSKKISFNQLLDKLEAPLENPRNNSVDSSTNDLLKADILEITSRSLELLSPISELNKPDKQYHHSFCNNFVLTLEKDGSCQPEVLILNRRWQDNATVSPNDRVDRYIDSNYRFTEFSKTAVVNSPSVILFQDRTEGKLSTVVFNRSVISEAEVVYPITNAESLSPQLLAQETVEPDVIDEPDVTEDEPKERAWQFEFTPFAFVPLNVDGDSTVEGVTSNISMDLGEVLEILTFAASGRFEAWYKNKFGIIFEAIYMELGDDGERILSGPRGLVDLGIEVDVDYEQAVFDLGFGYRIEIDDGDDEDKVSQAGLLDGHIDIIAGLRVQYLRQEADLNVELSGPFETVGIDRDLGQDETWVEPLLMARFSYQLSPRFALGTRGDISGFGIDDLSTTWRIITGFDWVFAGDTSLKLGYEVYSIDYKTSDDEFGLDQFQHGPYIGVTFRF